MSLRRFLKNLAPLLKRLISTHGIALLDDSARLRGLLSDFANEEALERNLIIVALEEGVPRALQQIQGRALEKTDLHQIAARLERNRGIQIDNAHYAVRVWAEALGIALEAHLEVIASLTQDRVHTFVTSGLAGYGKTTLASLLAQAISLNEAGNFDAALPILEQLAAENYRPAVVTPHLKKARESTAERAKQRFQEQALAAQIQNAYEDVALLASSRITLEEARQAWFAFQKNYPSWRQVIRDDPKNLSGRFGELWLLNGHTDSVNVLTWSSNGSALVSGSSDRTVRLWNAQSKQLTCVLSEHDHVVRSIAWSVDGRYMAVASGSFDRAVHIWDACTKSEVQVLKPFDGAVRSIAWSANGQFLAFGLSDRTVQVWDVQSNHLAWTLEGHTSSVICVAWSADGRLLASGSADRTVRIWQDNRLVDTLRGHDDSVRCLAWAADRYLLASGSSDHTVRLWDVQNSRLVRTLDENKRSVRCLAWAANKRTLAAGTADGTVQVWDADHGRRLWQFAEHNSCVNAVAWSPCGSYLASSSADGAIAVWRIPEWLSGNRAEW
ncbi:MAG: WD40 repeat domain-containing protein [Anaerolineae bacterium]|nr:WD40 repeat domain-containing protein [Anaerolineae bacterium]